MNIIISIRRFLIAIFALCLLINLGFNCFSWLSNDVLKPNKDENGVLIIYSYDKKELETIRKEHFDPINIKAFIKEDENTEPLLYVVCAEMTPKSFKYNLKYFESNKIPYKKGFSDSKKVSVEFGNPTKSKSEAESLSEKINSDIGITTAVQGKEFKKSFCLVVENIAYGKASELIDSFDKNINIKWVKRKKGF